MVKLLLPLCLAEVDQVGAFVRKAAVGKHPRLSAGQFQQVAQTDAQHLASRQPCIHVLLPDAAPEADDCFRASLASDGRSLRHAAVGKRRDGHGREVETERLSADDRDGDAEQRFRDFKLDLVQCSDDEVDCFHTDGRHLLQKSNDAQDHRLYHRQDFAHDVHSHLDGIDQRGAHQAYHRGQQRHNRRNTLIDDKPEYLRQHRLDVVHAQIHDLGEHTGKGLDQRHDCLDSRGHCAKHITHVQPSDVKTG